MKYAPLRDFIIGVSEFQRKYRGDENFYFDMTSQWPFVDITLDQSKTLLKSLWDYDWERNPEHHYTDFLRSLNLKEAVSNLDDEEARKYAREVFDKIEKLVFDIIYHCASTDDEGNDVHIGLHPSKI
jgi:hypothetical protein